MSWLLHGGGQFWNSAVPHSLTMNPSTLLWRIKDILDMGLTPEKPSSTIPLHQSPSTTTRSWWSGRTRSHAWSPGSGVWSSPPRPAPSHSLAGLGTLCMWPRLLQRGHTPPRCCNTEHVKLCNSVIPNTPETFHNENYNYVIINYY